MRKAWKTSAHLTLNSGSKSIRLNWKSGLKTPNAKESTNNSATSSCALASTSIWQDTSQKNLERRFRKSVRSLSRPHRSLLPSRIWRETSHLTTTKRRTNSMLVWSQKHSSNSFLKMESVQTLKARELMTRLRVIVILTAWVLLQRPIMVKESSVGTLRLGNAAKSGRVAI